MKKLTSMFEIWTYDCCVADTLGEMIEEIDTGLEFCEGEIHILEEFGKEIIWGNVKASKEFKQTYNLRDLSPMFQAGKIEVEAKKSGSVYVRLVSPNATAHSWTVNRIFLNLDRGLGFNGKGNSWIDTEDEITADLLNASKPFFIVNTLNTSYFPGRDVDSGMGVLLNISNIAHVVPMNYYDYLEEKEAAKKNK
jgi:hypothetical protein